MEKARFSVKPAYIIFFQVLILDQLTKLWVRLIYERGESIPVLESIFGETFRLTHVMNTGASFSLSLGSDSLNRYFFIGVAVLAVAFITYLLHHNTHKIQVIAFGLVAGGATGNMIDRIMRGGVTDFVDVNFPDFIMQRFPIFNVADSAIFIAMTLLIYEMFFIKEKKEPVEPQTELLSDTDLNNKEI